MIDTKNRNVLVLAYIGDAVYETYIRTYLINKSYSKVNELYKESIKYVSAKAQAEYIKQLLDNNFFKDEEIDIIKRARNHKSHNNKSTDIVTYKNATSLEAIIGYHYLNKNEERVKEIMSFILGEEC